jgi:hypothetical protein
VRHRRIGATAPTANGFQRRGKRSPEPTIREDQHAGEADPFRLPRRRRGPRFHPCRRVQEALGSAGIDYEKVIAAHGSPIPFLRRGSRDQLFAATGTRKLPTIKLPDGRIISNSKPILAWVHEQTERVKATKQAA